MLAALATPVSLAQTFPAKSVLIVTGTAGGASDMVARLVAEGLRARWGQPVVVENQGTASGIVAARTVAKAPADGYTLLAYGSPIWILPLSRSDLPYDPVRDFAPVTITVSSPNIVAVHPSLPVRSVRELIALAKARPGELNYGAGASGGSPHLSAELFKAMADVNMVHVAYRGVGPAVIALLSGEVQLMFASAGTALSHLKVGKLRGLAVTTARPSALFPDLPTVSASGVPGYESESVFGIFAPASTPTALVEQINMEIVRILHAQETKQRLLNAAIEPVGSSPQEFAATIKSDMAKWGKLLGSSTRRAK
jgi:tripartite-type tricarboxylate transporter receptor subunit TctC